MPEPSTLQLATRHDFARPLVLILGDQLSHELASLKQAPADSVIAFCEVEEEGRYVPHHPHKIAMMLAAMRHHAQELRECGWQVHESRLEDPDNLQRLSSEAERLAASANFEQSLSAPSADPLSCSQHSSSSPSMVLNRTVR